MEIQPSWVVSERRCFAACTWGKWGRATGNNLMTWGWFGSRYSIVGSSGCSLGGSDMTGLWRGSAWIAPSDCCSNAAAVELDSKCWEVSGLNPDFETVVVVGAAFSLPRSFQLT